MHCTLGKNSIFSLLADSILVAPFVLGLFVTLKTFFNLYETFKMINLSVLMDVIPSH